jgi:hypothetical protein
VLPDQDGFEVVPVASAAGECFVDNEILLLAETGQEGQVDVLSKSRVAPSLHRQPPDETEPPPLA